MAIRKTVFKTRAEWLAYRNQNFVIGGSNIGVILGLSNHKTPLQLWLEWKNRDAQPIKESMYRGRFMEDGIARWFQQQTGLKVVGRSKEIAVFHNDEYPDYIQVAPDREIFKEGTNLAGRPFLEIKDTAMHVDFDVPETIPSEWFLQCQFEAEIGGRPGTYLAVNDGSKTLKSRLILPEREYVRKCIEMACAWYERHIIGGEQPEPINGDDVQLLHPESTAGIIKVGHEVSQLHEQAMIYKRNANEAAKKYEEIKAKMSALFDERDTLAYEGRALATYRTIHQRRFDLAKFSEDHPDLAKEYTTISAYRKFDIKK